MVEAAQATPEQLALTEVNVGAYCINADWLWPALERLPLSPKGEYYLTDLVAWPWPKACRWPASPSTTTTK